MRGPTPPSVAVALVAAGTPARASTRSRGRVAGHSERLAARARRGDRAARTRLVEEHMGLVRSVAFRYRDLGLPFEDLVQEGAIGLLAAVDGYDPERGASFSTYAFWRIRAAVTHAVTAHGQLVRVPRPVRQRRREVARTRDRLRATGHDPSVAELAAASALPASAVAEALAPAGVVSLDQPGSRLVDRLVDGDTAGSPDARLVDGERARAVRDATRRLRGRKRAIISRHFGLAGPPETLSEIAGDLRLSPERTRALKDEALHELAAELDTALTA